MCVCLLMRRISRPSQLRAKFAGHTGRDVGRRNNIKHFQDMRRNLCFVGLSYFTATPTATAADQQIRSSSTPLVANNKVFFRFVLLFIAQSDSLITAGPCWSRDSSSPLGVRDFFCFSILFLTDWPCSDQQFMKAGAHPSSRWRK